MQILITPNWPDYQLIDTGDGQRLERFGQHILVRPDPQIIWKKTLPKEVWDKADAIFIKTSEEGGSWQKKTKLADKWLMGYKNLRFWVKLSPFKHTGVFPEQALQWDFISSKVKSAVSKHHQPTVLNLFGYTGIASLAAAAAGAKVVHIDASFPAIGWAKDNQTASLLQKAPIRWILDDAIKFCQRELRRGNKYEGIIMDPPIFGHGPKGEIWKFNESFPKLLEICSRLLSSQPLFLIANAYAISSSSLMLGNIFQDYLGYLGGNIEYGELSLEQSQDRRLLSTGIFAKWSI